MWCDNDKHSFSSNSGQINPTGDVGKLIIDVVKNNELRNIIDIGTWNGMGSTQCFLIALQNNTTTRFISIESNKDKNLVAINNLSDLLKNKTNADLYWGSIIDTQEIVNITDVFPEILDNSEFQRWHSIDIVNIDNSPYIFKFIPLEIDFVLFDGGEFTTYYEFLKLFPRCKKYIALDDVDVPKCKKIRSILQNTDGWKEISYIPERNGFSLFKFSADN